MKQIKEEMKETIFKSVTAIICVAIICLTMSSAVGKYSDAVTAAAEKMASVQVGGNNGGSTDADTTPDGVVDNSTDVTPDAGADATTPDAGTDATTPDAGTDATTPDAGTDAAKPDANAPAAQLSKADFIKLLNAETAKAAKGSYKLTRSGKFIKNINVGSATNTLNDIIHGVDENASLDSVVGGFLGIKAQPITGTVKAGKGEGFDAKYMIKAMNLSEADVTSYSVDGNKYTIKIKDCQNPTASSVMAKATNDYITFPEVNKSIANEVGSLVKVVENESVANYKNIQFIVTVVNGKITAMEYSYSFDAVLKLKLTLVPATGTGEAAISGKYTDIKY